MTTSEQATCACDTPRAEQIAQLNDQLRKSGLGGTIMMTRGVLNLPGCDVRSILAKLRSYAAFDTDNDPHGERDFGDIDYAGASLLWKIDYYDSDLIYASPDPADPKVTQRVLTVMLAEEY